MILCHWFGLGVFFKSGFEISLFSCVKLSFEVILCLTHPWLFMNILTKLKAHFPLRKTRNRFVSGSTVLHNYIVIPKRGILTSLKLYCCKSLITTMKGYAWYQAQDWGEPAFHIKGKWMRMTSIYWKGKLVEGSMGLQWMLRAISSPKQVALEVFVWQRTPTGIPKEVKPSMLLAPG